MGNYLADRRKALGLTQKDVADAVGVSEATVSRWESGEIANMRRDRISALAKVLHCSTDFVMTGEEQEDISIPPGFDPLPLMRKVPLIGQIACGEPITADENIEEYVEVPVQYHCDFCLKCVGDSMIEANINDGDIVYIRKQPTVENGDIAAVRIGEEATLKRVYLDGECVVLAPANSKYPPRSYRGQELENIHIEGKAVGFTHWF